jgi:hypothetical protein
MKTLLSLMVVSLLFWTGCQESSSIVEPETVQTSAPNWIELPKNTSQSSSIEMEFSASENIDGNSGGEIKLDRNYYGPNGKVKIIAKLKFDKGSFNGTKLITMIVDDVNGTVTYSPSMNFDKPAELYLKLEGLDLSGINPDDIDFVYFSPSGTYGPITYKEIKVDIQSGTLELKDGLIPHFSRFGFCR